MSRALQGALVALGVASAAPALAQNAAPAVTAAQQSQTNLGVERALGNQPLFPNLRGGTLGVPSFTGQENVTAQAAVRIDGNTPVVDLFANFSNLHLSPSIALSLFAESAQVDSPRAAFDPNAATAPNPLPAVGLQSFQGIGFRVRVQLERGGRDAEECNRALQLQRADALAHPDRPLPPPPSACPWLRSTSVTEYTERYYRMRAQELFGGPQLFFGARYLYRGTPKTGAAASGVAAELGYLQQIDVDWRVYFSVSFAWLARAESTADGNTVVLPSTMEFRGNAGLSWRPTFTPERSVTLGLQASLAFNRWDNDFARGAQARTVQGSSFEACLSGCHPRPARAETYELTSRLVPRAA